MKPGEREDDLLVKGVGLKVRFVFALMGALAAVLILSAVLLYAATMSIVRSAESDALDRAVRFTHTHPKVQVASEGLVAESGVQIFPYHSEDDGKDGLVYRHEMTTSEGFDRLNLYVPAGDPLGGSVLKVIVFTFVFVLLVGVGVSIWLANSVSRPVEALIYDVRQIALGNLRHRTKSSGPTELRLLGRAIDRMSADLAEGKETEFQLSVRQRELDLASSVRNALLPEGTPLIEGYDLGAAFLASPQFGGDFHEFVRRADGLWGVLVGEVSGRGVPAGLVGATARAYLRSELERVGEVADAFHRVNRWLVEDVRRGMFVTALYALLDPAQGRATVACAGHKIPLLRVCAADGQLRVVQPEGIALGFDKGPVFERRLQVVEVPIEPGDRLVLANSAPVRIQGDEGELGEKAFYARVRKHCVADTTVFLRALRRDLESYAGEGGFQEDIAIVTLYRNPV